MARENKSLRPYLNINKKSSRCSGKPTVPPTSEAQPATSNQKEIDFSRGDCSSVHAMLTERSSRKLQSTQV